MRRDDRGDLADPIGAQFGIAEQHVVEAAARHGIGFDSRIEIVLQHRRRDRAIEQPGIKMRQLVTMRERARDRALARRGGAIDGNDHTWPVSWRSEEHTSELKSLMRSSYAVFCLKQTKITM